MDEPFSSVSSRIKQRAVIEFLTHENEAPVEIHRRLLAVYDEQTVDISTVRRWVRKSKASGGKLDVTYQPRSGRPTTSTNEQNKQKVNELIRENRRITQRTIAETLSISLASVNETVSDLEYTKVCARWVPRQLTPEMKTVRLQTCQMLLTRYEREGDNFGFEVLDHPPYSPDLAPSDVWLFGTLKKHLRGIHFTSDEEVQAATIKWFREQPEQFYSDGFQKLIERWRRCIERLGDYVEK